MNVLSSRWRWLNSWTSWAAGKLQKNVQRFAIVSENVNFRRFIDREGCFSFCFAVVPLAPSQHNLPERNWVFQLRPKLLRKFNFVGNTNIGASVSPRCRFGNLRHFILITPFSLDDFFSYLQRLGHWLIVLSQRNKHVWLFLYKLYRCSLQKLLASNPFRSGIPRGRRKRFVMLLIDLGTGNSWISALTNLLG